MFKRLGLTGLATALLATSVAGLTAVPALGDASGTVTASVGVRAAAVPCLTLSASSLSFGTDVALSPAGGVNLVDATTSPTLTVCSTEPEIILGRVTAFTGAGASWTPTPFGEAPVSCAAGGTLVGGDKFALTVSATNSALLTWGNTLDLLDIDLTPFAVSGAWTLNHDLYMPCAGSSGAGATMSATITYTALLD
ncbi:MAG: hypothetical protein ACKVVT_13255 [Dehalococcoidia bacterium]